MSDVSTPSAENKEHLDLAQLPRTLMGGTKAMRKAGIYYLPQEIKETTEAYQARLKRSTLFNGFRKTVKDMTGKVFAKPVVLEDDVPKQIEGYAENIDLAGRHLNVFARDVFFDTMQTGIGYIFTDKPAAATQGSGRNGEVTRADEAGARPYLCYVKAEDMLGWLSETINGVVTLTQVRIREVATVKSGDYAEESIEQIRVLRPGSWEIWRKSTDDQTKNQWVKFDEGTTSLTKIAIAPVYINRTAFMCGAPPLEDLADLNVAHWQSQSDQRNILHVARVPILFGSGFSEQDTIAVGASQMVRTTDANAKLQYVEHTGKAIDSGDKDLQNLELQMQAMGLQLLIDGPGGQTATGEMRDESKENSPLAMMARALGDALELSLGFMAEYDGLGEDKGGSVIVNQDYGVEAGHTDLQQLLAARVAGEISRETFWEEMQRRNFLSDSFDPETEQARLASEAPTLDAGAGNGMNLEETSGGPDAVKVGVTGRASITAAKAPNGTPDKSAA